MRLAKPCLLVSTILAASTLTAKADINVVASIKPVHSLVAAVMQGAREPGLIVKGAGSPHTYTMKPSDANMLQDADVVFWMGHELEPFLEKPLETIPTKATTIELMDAHDLVKLRFREGGAFDAHDHDDEHGHEDHAHDEHDHDDHAHEAKAEADHGHDDHDHEAEAEAAHDHDHAETAKAGHEGHDHDGFDPHIWLDPVNAKALVHEIEEALVEADPGNAATYEANAEAVMAKLDGLVSEVETEVAGLSEKGFIVFHDAYRYFEERFGLEASGSVTVSPEVMPGAERVDELRKTVTDAGVACVFSEPQFEPKLVATVTEGTQARSGVLDPLGAELTDGPELYFDLIRNMAASFKDCLSASS